MLIEHTHTHHVHQGRNYNRPIMAHQRTPTPGIIAHNRQNNSASLGGWENTTWLWDKDSSRASREDFTLSIPLLKLGAAALKEPFGDFPKLKEIGDMADYRRAGPCLFAAMACVTAGRWGWDLLLLPLFLNHHSGCRTCFAEAKKKRYNTIYLYRPSTMLSWY